MRLLPKKGKASTVGCHIQPPRVSTSACKWIASQKLQEAAPRQQTMSEPSLFLVSSNLMLKMVTLKNLRKDSGRSGHFRIIKVR